MPSCCNLLGIRQIVVVVNKMDLVGCAEARFAAIRREYRRAIWTSIGIAPNFVIPVVARDGDNLVHALGAHALVRRRDADRRARSVPQPATWPHLPLRLPIQDVYKFDDRRILAGRIESGRLQGRRPAAVLALQQGGARQEHRGLERRGAATSVGPGQSIGITTRRADLRRARRDRQPRDPPADRDQRVPRPPVLAGQEAADAPATRIGCGSQTRDVPVIVEAIEAIYDPDALAQHPADKVERNDDRRRDPAHPRHAGARRGGPESAHRAASCWATAPTSSPAAPSACDGYPDQRKPVTAKSTNITAVAHRVEQSAANARNGHKGGVLWFTGLSGAGKSTIAMAVEQELFRRGYQIYVLDGDNVRHGLNSNLGFSPDGSRGEHPARRRGRRLFADAGLIVVTAFISPYRADRDRARAAAGDGFHEIYIKADLETCEKRDPKGLYRKARSGEIADFTGVTAPYEAPESAELTIDTDRLSIEKSVARIIVYIEKNFVITRQTAPVAPA